MYHNVMFTWSFVYCNGNVKFGDVCSEHAYTHTRQTVAGVVTTPHGDTQCLSGVTCEFIVGIPVF